jgi:hypothetical protein
MAQCACDITPRQRVFSLARILSAENAAGFSARTEVLELHVMREGSSHAAMPEATARRWWPDAQRATPWSRQKEAGSRRPKKL